MQAHASSQARRRCALSHVGPFVKETEAHQVAMVLYVKASIAVAMPDDTVVPSEESVACTAGLSQLPQKLPDTGDWPTNPQLIRDPLARDANRIALDCTFISLT